LIAHYGLQDALLDLLDQDERAIAASLKTKRAM
jgi:hypothetical protein